MRPRKVAIIGGAGSTARNGLVPMFDTMATEFFGKDHGIELIGFDIEQNLDLLIDLYGKDRAFALDVTQTEQGWENLEGVTHVINTVMAAPGAGIEDYERVAKLVHEGGMRNLIHFADLYGVDTIGHMGTFNEYDDPAHTAFEALYGEKLTEDLKKFPAKQRKGIWYAITKWNAFLIAEKYVKAAADGRDPVKIAAGVFSGITSSTSTRGDSWNKLKQEKRLGPHNTHIEDVAQFLYRLVFCPTEDVFTNPEVPIERYFCGQRHSKLPWSIDKAIRNLGYDPFYSTDVKFDKSGTAVQSFN